jgi:hypothetical protein
VTVKAAVQEVESMALRQRDAGAGTVRELLFLGSLAVLVCALYLVMDVRHRVEGHRAVHGKGVGGTATVTRCAKDTWRTYCSGDFISDDGKVVRRNVRINGAADLLGWDGGAFPGPARHRAAISRGEADEVWTAEGVPWWTFSRGQLLVTAFVGLGLGALWRSLSFGDRETRRELARQRMIRQGRVH